MTGIAAHGHSIGVAMVTHNARPYLTMQLESILAQDRRPDGMVIVDDSSTDGTWEDLLAFRESTPIRVDLFRSRTTPGSRHLFSRIAANFSQALRESADRYSIVLVADQDDVWLPNRLDTQVAALMSSDRPGVAVADADLIDDLGRPLAGTLRARFPIPHGWEAWPRDVRFRYVLRNPVATGAAMALTTEFIDTSLPVPYGWLHDRWLSILAAATGRLDVQENSVIQYRLHDAQSVGQRDIRRDAPVRWYVDMALDWRVAASRWRSLRQLRHHYEANTVAHDLSWIRLAGGLLTRNSGRTP